MIYCRTLIFYEFGWFYIYETLSNQSDCLNLSDKDSDWLIVSSILEGGGGGGERGIGDHFSCPTASCMRYNRKEQTHSFSICKYYSLLLFSICKSHDVFYHPSYLLRSACALISTFALPPCYKHSNVLFMSIVGIQTVLHKGVSR